MTERRLGTSKSARALSLIRLTAVNCETGRDVILHVARNIIPKPQRRTHDSVCTAFILNNSFLSWCLFDGAASCVEII
jgi:hypothetical protein